MIVRELKNFGNSKALILDKLLLENLDLNEEKARVNIIIENNRLIITKNIDNINESHTKEEKKTIRNLFKDNKIKIGDKVIYYQAVEENKTNSSDNKVIATVIHNANEKRDYLKSDYDNQVYSFSSLRAKIIEDFALTETNKDWGHKNQDEWRLLINNQKLSEL